MVDAVTPYICTRCMTVTTHLSLAAGRSVPLGDVLGAYLGVAGTKLGQVTLC